MNTIILLAALLGADAAPPQDPKLAVIESILPTPAETLKNLEKSITTVLDSMDKEALDKLPRGWKAEYLKMWRTKGVARMRAAHMKHLKENFTLKELKTLQAMTKGGNIRTLDEAAQRQLEKKMDAYMKFAQQTGAEIGAEMGEEAELKLARKEF